MRDSGQDGHQTVTRQARMTKNVFVVFLLVRG